jgi:hypothetical protein
LAPARAELVAERRLTRRVFGAGRRGRLPKGRLLEKGAVAVVWRRPALNLFDKRRLTRRFSARKTA